MPAASKRLKNSTLLFWMLLPGGLVILTVLVAPLLLNWNSVRHWENYRQAALAKGRILELQEPAPAIDPAQNFAAAAPFRPVEVDEDGKPTKPPLLPTDWLLMKFMPDLVKGKRADFKGMGEQLKVASPRSDVAVGKAILSACDENLRDEWPAILAAEAKPQTRFGLRYFPLPVSEKLPVADLRTAVQTHEIRAVALLHLKRSAEALKEVRGALRICAAMKTEPDLIDHMLNTASTTLLVDTVWEGLAQGAWSDGDLVALEHEFASLHTSAGYSQAIEHERRWMNCLFNSVLKPIPGHRDTLHLWMPGDEAGLVAMRALCRIPGVVRENQLVANRQWDAVEQQIDAQGNWHPSPLPLDLDHLPTPEKLRLCLVEISLPNYWRAERRVLATEAGIRQLRLAIALERFRRAHGSFPDRLEEIVPQYLPAIPVDPMDGAPMRYAKDAANRFRLWSVGDNRRDDGGKSDGEFIEGKLDLVWPGS